MIGPWEGLEERDLVNFTNFITFQFFYPIIQVFVSQIVDQKINFNVIIIVKVHIINTHIIIVNFNSSYEFEMINFWI